jgi:hypothetical protein
MQHAAARRALALEAAIVGIDQLDLVEQRLKIRHGPRRGRLR